MLNDSGQPHHLMVDKGGEWSDAAQIVDMIAMKSVFNQVQRQ